MSWARRTVHALPADRRFRLRIVTVGVDQIERVMWEGDDRARALEVYETTAPQTPDGCTTRLDVQDITPPPWRTILGRNGGDDNDDD